MIINNTQQEFEDVPGTLNDEVLLERPAAGGFITCPQETAYLYAVATDEQRTNAGHASYDYSTLNKTICRKPDISKLVIQQATYAQEILDGLDIVEQRKIGLQNRINGLAVAVNQVDLDAGLQLILQLPLDILNTP